MTYECPTHGQSTIFMENETTRERFCAIQGCGDMLVDTSLPVKLGLSDAELTVIANVLEAISRVGVSKLPREVADEIKASPLMLKTWAADLRYWRDQGDAVETTAADWVALREKIQERQEDRLAGRKRSEIHDSYELVEVDLLDWVMTTMDEWGAGG
jgi:hypothetical protein